MVISFYNLADTLKVVELNGLKITLQYTVKKAIKNKVFDKGTIDGYTVGAIDGTKFFGSNKKSCSECLKNIKSDKTHSFHNGARAKRSRKTTFRRYEEL